MLHSDSDAPGLSRRAKIGLPSTYSPETMAMAPRPPAFLRICTGCGHTVNLQTYLQPWLPHTTCPHCGSRTNLERRT